MAARETHHCDILKRGMHCQSVILYTLIYPCSVCITERQVPMTDYKSQREVLTASTMHHVPAAKTSDLPVLCVMT